MREMKRVFGISEDSDTQLWVKNMSNSHELHGNLEQTLQDAGLYHGQV